MQVCTIDELATMLRVAVISLRRRHAAGTLIPACRTLGGHRRYDLTAVRGIVGLDVQTEKLTIAYARVSSYDQAKQLPTQAQRLQRHCEEQHYPNLEVTTALGSGMNQRKKGLKNLMLAILRGQAGRIVLVTKDQLLRFGSELLFSICHFFQVEVDVLDADVDCRKMHSHCRGKHRP